VKNSSPNKLHDRFPSQHTMFFVRDTIFPFLFRNRCRARTHRICVKRPVKCRRLKVSRNLRRLHLSSSLKTGMSYGSNKITSYSFFYGYCSVGTSNTCEFVFGALFRSANVYRELYLFSVTFKNTIFFFCYVKEEGKVILL